MDTMEPGALMEGVQDLDSDEKLKFNLFMMRILGPVLALERCDRKAQESLVPFMRQFFSRAPGAIAWIEWARNDPGLAPMVAAYDHMAFEQSRSTP